MTAAGNAQKIFLPKDIAQRGNWQIANAIIWHDKAELR